MESFYGGRRGIKGDSLTDININANGKLEYTITSYKDADGNGTDDTKTTKDFSFPASKVTYTPTEATEVTDIDSYIKSLGYTKTGSKSKTITKITEKDGQINATIEDISIVSSQISDISKNEDTDNSGVTTLNKVNSLIPASLPASNVTNDYSSTGTAPISGKGVAAALANINNFMTVIPSDSTVEKQNDILYLIYDKETGEASLYYKPTPEVSETSEDTETTS